MGLLEKETCKNCKGNGYRINDYMAKEPCKRCKGTGLVAASSQPDSKQSKGRPRLVPDHLRELVIELRRNGAGYTEIQRKTGVKVGTAYSICRELCIKENYNGQV